MGKEERKHKEREREGERESGGEREEGGRKERSKEREAQGHTGKQARVGRWRLCGHDQQAVCSSTAGYKLLVCAGAIPDARVDACHMF